MKNTIPFKRTFMLLTFAVFALGSVFADYARTSIPDSSLVRRAVMESWLVAPVSQLNGKPSEVYADPSGIPFQVRSEREGQSTVIIVCPQTMLKVSNMMGDAVEVVEEPAYSRNSKGAWLLYRNRVSGAPEKIVIRFTENSDVYIQLRPEGKKTVIDMLAYGSFLSRGVPVSIPFENLYTTSFQTIQSQTRKSLPWGNVVPDSDQYGAVQSMIPVIRRRLPAMAYAEDAAYNENGELYSITLNEPFNKKDEDEALNYWLKNKTDDLDVESVVTVGASGFVKWVVDGLVKPVIGKGTKLSEIVAPTIRLSGTTKMAVTSQAWNLSLNLDWNRHLAEKLFSIRSSKGNFTWDTCGVDVTDNFFVSKITDDGRVIPAHQYVQNVGYKAEDLKPLMYVLAVTEPDWFFLGAVRHTSAYKADESVFDSNAVFFPFFRNGGKFDCVVFQNGKELTLEQFIKNNPGAYIHFERVKASSIFDPM